MVPPNPYFPERFLAARPRFEALRAQYGVADFDNYAEPTWELRDALREMAASWQVQHKIPAALLASQPAKPIFDEADPNDTDTPESRAWFAWYKQVEQHRIHHPRLEEELQAIKALLDFHKSGRNIFALAPALQEMLRHTAVDAVHWEDLQLPYPSLYLHFGSDSGIELPIEYYAGKFSDEQQDLLPGVDYWLDGAFVHQIHGIHYGGALEILLTFRCTEDDFTRRVALDKDFRFPVVSFSIDFGHSAEMPAGRSCAEAAITFSSLWDAKQEVLELEYGKMRELLAVNEFEYDSERADYRLFEQSMMLIINSLCYLGLPKQQQRTVASTAAAEDLIRQVRQAKNKQRKYPLQQKLAKLSYSTIRFCGEELTALRGTGLGGGDVVAHWRRGHWRRQPVGVGRGGVRLLWIKPTIVGKGTPAQGHVYEVDSQQSSGEPDETGI